jgi:hypothetical protein
MEITKFQKGMEVFYDTDVQNTDGYTGGFVLLERLPGYDGRDHGAKHR